MGQFRVFIEDTGESYVTSDQRSVLEGMAALGRKGIPVGCCGGGCGVCKVEVVSGSYRKRAMSRAHVSVEDEAGNRVLACRVWPTSDLRLRVIGKFRKTICREAAVTG